MIFLDFKGSNRKFSLSSKTGTLLPEFPNAENLILPENVDRDKVNNTEIYIDVWIFTCSTCGKCMVNVRI